MGNMFCCKLSGRNFKIEGNHFFLRQLQGMTVPLQLPNRSRMYFLILPSTFQLCTSIIWYLPKLLILGVQVSTGGFSWPCVEWKNVRMDHSLRKAWSGQLGINAAGTVYRYTQLWGLLQWGYQHIWKWFHVDFQWSDISDTCMWVRWPRKT